MTIEPIALDDPRATDAAVTGTKAAGLARLRSAGFDVPHGVVLPVGVAAAWPDGPAPDDLRDAIEGICSSIGAPVAVRSSATWEDNATSAHAGATKTVLDVTGTDAVLGAVRGCLDATADARQAHGARGETAILVQRLVPADWAGVAFSADPVTGERDVVRIAATPGLGEALVQGEVVGIDVTVRGQRIDGDLGGLDVDLALAVAAVTRKIEAEIGVPQDVEWATTGGHVHVLQARPITVLPVEPTYPTGNNWQKDTAHYPEPLTPFGWSTLELGAEDVRSVFDEAGVLIRGLEEVFVGGEIYGRVLPAFGSADGAGSPPPAFVLGVASRIVPPIRRRVATAKKVVASGLFQQWAHDWHRRDREVMSRREAELRSVDLAALDAAALVAHLDRCIELTRDGQRIHFRLVMPLFGALYRLREIVREELGWDDSEVFRMLAGHSPATRAADEALDGLRARARAVEGLVDALGTADDPLEVLARFDQDLAAAVAGWVDEHGWAMVNYDAGVAVLAERPATITKLLLNDADRASFTDADEVATRARDAIRPERRADFDAALADARAIYPVREDNTIIVGDRPLALLRRWMLEVARRVVALGLIGSNADAAYLTVDELRRAVEGTGGLRLDDTIRRRRGEEEWARATPGPAYLGEQGPMPDISRTPAALRAVNEPILWGVAHEYPRPVERPDDDRVLLAGVAASAGVATGTVRVIRSHTDIDLLQPGDVLVCQVTSPSWAPLFPLATAVVADGGGVLSHAAIAAREHGLPAVLGTGSATSELHDGQAVRVDGTRGLVLTAGSEATS
jgi:pyruvate,water dikinase